MSIFLLHLCYNCIICNILLEYIQICDIILSNFEGLSPNYPKGKKRTVPKLPKGKKRDRSQISQNKGAENINLVTPTSYAIQIKQAIIIAKQKGLKLPIIYNTNGYEDIKTLKMLEGYIDIYLPDLKYYYDKTAKKYSNIDGYFEIATKAIKEMYRQVGYTKLDENGNIKKGLIIRHLILPGNIQNSKKILKYIKENIDPKVYISIMAQYFPTYKAKENSKINRKLTKEEYKEIEDYVYSINIENGYLQELGDHEEEYVPKWNLG